MAEDGHFLQNLELVEVRMNLRGNVPFGQVAEFGVGESQMLGQGTSGLCGSERFSLERCSFPSVFCTRIVCLFHLA